MAETAVPRVRCDPLERYWAGMGFLLLIVMLLGACSSAATPWGTRRAVDGPAPDLPVLESPREQDDKLIVRVLNGQVPQLGGHITRLSPGPRTLLVVHGESNEATDMPQPIALWLRGRGSARSRLPQFTSGLVNPGNSQDWQVDLEPGDYLLSVTLGADATQEDARIAHILVR